MIPDVLGGEIGAERERLGPIPTRAAKWAIPTGPRAFILFRYCRLRRAPKKGYFGRSKYRIRRTGESEGVFLERKLKNRDMMSRRRSIIRADDLKRLGDSIPQHGWARILVHPLAR